VLEREAAHVGVRRDVRPVDGHVVPGQRQRREGVAVLAHPGHEVQPGDDRQRRLQHQRERGGRAVDHAGLVAHQAPSIIWPQTRTTLPLTAVEPGLAYHAIVSATSTGRPPCDSALSRRPTSRVANGTAAVILVSMKPGATALTVMPCSSSSARLSTKPMTPALDVA